MPVVVQRQVTMIQAVLRIVDVQQLQFIGQVIEILVLTQADPSGANDSEDREDPTGPLHCRAEDSGNHTTTSSLTEQ